MFRQSVSGGGARAAQRPADDDNDAPGSIKAFLPVVVEMMVSINTSCSATPIIMIMVMVMTMHKAEEEEALPTVEEAAETLLTKEEAPGGSLSIAHLSKVVCVRRWRAKHHGRCRLDTWEEAVAEPRGIDVWSVIYQDFIGFCNDIIMIDSVVVVRLPDNAPHPAVVVVVR